MDAAEFERTLEDCELRLDRLRALYEQYFQGLERLEPLIPRKELERRVRSLRGNVPRNTRLRFRFQQMVSKYTTYQNYWRRIARQIEEGTYRRDLLKARRRRDEARQARKVADQPRENMAAGIRIDVDFDSMDIEAEVAAASADASAAAAAILSGPDDVLAAIDNVGPRSISPETGPRSLSPFAIPSKRPAAPAQESPKKAAAAPAPIPTADGPTTRTFGKPFSKPPAKAAVPDRLGLDLSGLEAAPIKKPAQKRPAQRPAPNRPAQRPPAARPVKAAPKDDASMRQVYDRYVEARRRNNERVDNVRFESVKKSIEKQLPKLQQKHKGKKIDFEVVIRNGKVGLKPVPK